MLENRNNNRKTGQKGQVKKGFRQEQHSNVNLLEQNSNLAEDYYFKLSKFAGNKTVQRMVEDGSMFNHQQTESTVDMKGLTQRKVKEVNNYVPPKKVAPKNYTKKSSSTTSTNKTGLPDQLKTGIEGLANMDLSDIRVHYNSKKPKDINAHAFTQGSDIHVASGQEKHLAHEAWHVVQQKQGRVKPTTQVGGVNVNDNKHLEREADVMGSKALKSGGKKPVSKSAPAAKSGKGAVQRKTKNVNGLPRDVIKSSVVDSNKTNKIESTISKYNKLDIEDKDFGEHKTILKYILDLFSKLKPEGGTKKKSAKPKASKGKKGKKGKKRSAKKSSPSADKPQKIDINANKQEVEEELKAVEGQIRTEVIIQEEIAKRKEAEAQEAAARVEEEKGKGDGKEKKAAPEAEKVNKAEVKAKKQDGAKDKPEGKAQKRAKEEQKEEQKKQSIEKQEEEQKVKAKKQGNEKTKTEDKGGDGQKAAAGEKNNTKDKLKKAEEQKDKNAEKADEKKNRKEQKAAKEQDKKQEQENASKEKEVNKNKDKKAESANAQEQKVAKEQQEKQNKNDIKKKKEDDKALEAAKAGKEKEEKAKEAAEKRGEKPSFTQVRKLAAGSQFKSLLKLYGYNWFTAKKHLTTTTFAKDKNEYYERENVMSKLVSFRQKVTDDLLKDTLSRSAKMLLNKVGSEQKLGSSFSVNSKGGNKGWVATAIADTVIIDAMAPGSQTITSDIDVTFGAPGNEEFEVNLVRIFNGLFRKKWGVSSGVLLDVNAYTSGFMSKAAGKGKEEAEKNAELLGEASFDDVVKSNEKTQLAVGLLPVREFFGEDKDQWKKFINKTKQTLSKELRANKVSSDNRKVVMGTIGGVFEQTEGLYVDTSVALANELEGTKSLDGNLSKEHVQAVASDKLYEKQLGKVKKLLMDRKRVSKEISKLMELDKSGKLDSKGIRGLETLRNKLSNNLKEFDVEQGKALVYANEAYYNAGAVTHVVKGMQAGGDVKLGQQELMESLLMNIGYKLKHFEHHLKEDGQGNALVTTSKYGQRIDSALKQLDTIDNQLTEDKEMLDNELNLLNNYKKSSQFSAQPARESEAKKNFGQSMSNERVNTGYLRIAQSNLVSFYISKVDSLRKK